MQDMMMHQARTDELLIIFHFVDGEKFTQSLPIDEADAAESVMEWFNNKKGDPAFFWINPNTSRVNIVPRSQVTFIEIHGYQVPNGNKSRWYHHVTDKFRTWWMLRKM